MVWEYLVLYYGYSVGRVVIQNELDRFGLERWELISTVFNPIEQRIEYFLKRESLERIA